MTEKRPMISVIVPVYNTAPFLNRCVESILGQTYEHLQVILVDDGSTDESGGLCDQWAVRDPRVQVIHQENGGLSAARNAGLEICTGEFVAFVDSDDYVFPEMYEKMLRRLRSHGAAMAVCQWQYEKPDGTWVVDTARVNRAMFGRMTSREFARGLYLGDYENGLVVSAWNKLYRRAILGDLRFEGRYAEDDDFHTALLSGDFEVTVLEEQLYVYVEHPGSLSRRGFRAEALRILDILEERTRRFREDPFLVAESMRTYCNLYIEYHFRAKAAGIPMPGRRRFCRFVRLLAGRRDCTVKFLLRMGLFLLSPRLYGRLTGLDQYPTGG